MPHRPDHHRVVRGALRSLAGQPKTPDRRGIVRQATLHLEFTDGGSIVHHLHEVIWIVPYFALSVVARSRRHQALAAAEDSFVAHTERLMVESRKPS